jgi:hypothetical protein
MTKHLLRSVKVLLRSLQLKKGSVGKNICERWSLIGVLSIERKEPAGGQETHQKLINATKMRYQKLWNGLETVVSEIV